MTSKWANSNSARLELLGVGSSKTRAFKANLEEAMRQLELDLPIIEVTHIDQLLQYDISGIPALAVNGKVVFQRIVPAIEDIKIVLQVLLQTEMSGTQIKQVLVPVDFSETAENAFRYALDLGEYLRANLKMVHIHQPYVELGNTLRLEASKDNGPYKERLMKAMRDRHLRSRTSPNDRKAIEVSTELIDGFIVEEICRLSSEGENDLIVMGTTGEGGLFGRWFGSVSSQVARRASSPVLLVPDGVHFKSFDRIVYASNHGPADENILPQMIDFARPFGASIYFAHVHENKLRPYQVLSTPDGRFFHSNGLTFHLANIESKDVIEGLSRFAEETRADLMVMSTTQRGFVEELFHNSATRRMIFNSRIPIMVLHY